MSHKYYQYILFFLLVLSNTVFSQKTIQKISSEQKNYELGVVWKELSYNFANMDNCPNVSLDSLYKAYIPLVKETKNDFEYCKVMQNFLSHFNNSHVNLEIPRYVVEELAYPLLITSLEDGKLIIKNIGNHYSKTQLIGCEILLIDGMQARKYLETKGIPYFSESNVDTKLQNAMFGFGLNYYQPKAYHKKLKLEIKTPSGVERVIIPYDKYFKSDDVKQNNLKYLKAQDENQKKENVFISDLADKFAYLRLSSCDKQMQDFYISKFDSILTHKNLILDLTNNGGGEGQYTATTIFSLTDVDTLKWMDLKTRVNNAHFKAKGASKIYYYEPKDISEKDKKLYYPYFYDNAFEMVENRMFYNPNPKNSRFLGNIYVMMNNGTASAAEQMILTMKLSRKVILLGKKTAGALGQPLTVKLPSGINVFINTSKTLDVNGKDVSNGITPDYFCDFSNFYFIENKKSFLSELVDYIGKILRYN